jgi:hypothetical protein
LTTRDKVLAFDFEGKLTEAQGKAKLNPASDLTHTMFIE